MMIVSLLWESNIYLVYKLDISDDYSSVDHTTAPKAWCDHLKKLMVMVTSWNKTFELLPFENGLLCGTERRAACHWANAQR